MKMFKSLFVFFLLFLSSSILQAAEVFDWNVDYQTSSPVFDGTNSYSTSTTSLAISDQMTVVTWVKFSDLSQGRQKIICKSDSNLSDIELSIGKYEWAPRIEVYISTSNQNNLRLVTDTVNTITLDQWMQIMVVYDGLEVSVYLDGELNVSAALTGNLKSTAYDTYIGGLSGGDYFNGSISKVEIYDYAYSGTEIDASYPSSIANKSVFNWLAADQSPAPDFDGTNSYSSSTTSLDINDKMTVAAWVKFSDLSQGRQKIICKSDNNLYDIELSIGKYEWGPRIEIFISTDNQSNLRLVTDTVNTITLDQWMQIMLVYDGQEVSVYLDGELNVSAALTGNLKNTTYDTYIGGLASGDYFNGNISKVEIYDYVNLSLLNDPTNKNITWQWLYVDQSPSPVFDGTTSYSTGVSDLEIAGDDTCTVSAWIMIDSICEGRQKIFYKGDQNQAAPNISLGKYEYGPNAEFRLTTVGNQTCRVVGGFIKPQRWTYITGVYDSQYLKLYVNGQLVKSASYSGLIENTSDLAYVGSSFNNDRFTGMIESVKVQALALSDTEVLNSYNLTKEKRVNAEISVIDYSVKTSGQKLIYSGWDSPTSMFVKNNWQTMDSTPLDGTSIAVLVDRSLPVSTANLLCWQVTSSQVNLTVNDAFYTGAVSDMTNVSFTNLNENMLRVKINGSASSDLYWYDSTRWTQFINNWKVLVNLAKDLNCKGIIIDTEDYNGHLFSYQHQYNYNQSSFTNYETQVTSRAKTMIDEMKAIAPELNLHFYFAWPLYYSEVVAKNISPENSEYGLLLSFLDGLVENCHSSAKVIDLYEYSYSYMTEDDFASSLTERDSYLSSLYTATELDRTGNGFGLFLDNGAVWDTTVFDNNYFTPKDFSYALYYAFKNGAEYVWIYSQNARFFNNPSIPQAYLDEMDKF